MSNFEYKHTHRWVPDPCTFQPRCKQCEDIMNSIHNALDMETFENWLQDDLYDKKETPEQAYERAMKGVV